MRGAKAKLATICQQIEQDASVLLGGIGDKRAIALRNAWLVRNITFGALSFGTLLLALGIVGKGPLYNPSLNKIVFVLLHISFGGAMAACLHSWMYYSTMYSNLQEESTRENVVEDARPNLVSENLNSIVSELKGMVPDSEALVRSDLLVSELEVALDRFFTADTDPTEMETNKVNLREVLDCLN